MVAKMVAKKAVPVVVIIQPNLLVLIVALLAAMAVKKVAVMVVRILLSLLVQDVVIVALVPALLPVPMIVQKVAWILAVVHVFQRQMCIRDRGTCMFACQTGCRGGCRSYNRY